MPTDNDRASASIRFEGEAHRLTIRRPRLDRDGLFLFGRRYATQTVTLTVDDVDHLHRGRTIAVDVAGQYLIYLRIHPLDDDEPRVPRTAAVPVSSPCAEDRISPGERSDQVPSGLGQAAAALVRVNADRGAGVPTHQWIVDLANSEQISYRRGGAVTTKRLSLAHGLRRLWRNWRANIGQRRGRPRRSRGGPQ